MLFFNFPLICKNDPFKDEKEKDERVKALLRFVQTNESGEDDLTNRLAALAMNLTPEQIAEITGLPLEQVLALQKELTAQPAPAN